MRRFKSKTQFKLQFKMFKLEDKEDKIIKGRHITREDNDHAFFVSTLHVAEALVIMNELLANPINN